MNQLKKIPSFEGKILDSFEIHLVDHLGRRLNLMQDLVSKHPVWLHFFSLHHPQLQQDLTQLSSMVKSLPAELGQDFSICSISMDAKHDFLHQLYQLARDQELIVPGWHFSVLSEPQTAHLLEEFCVGSFDDEAPRMFLLHKVAGGVSAMILPLFAVEADDAQDSDQRMQQVVSL